MMRGEVPQAQWTQLSELVAGTMGLHFPRERWDDLQRGLAGAAQEFGFDDAAACIGWLLAAAPTKAQLQVLAGHLTIGETYFFRDGETLEALAHTILPELIRARRGREQRLRIWSAACCSGRRTVFAVVIAFQAMEGETVKLMSEVKVVRRTARLRPTPLPSAHRAPAGEYQRAPAQIKLIGIGASTGGPPVLQTILAGLPKDFPVPVLIVQHIAQGFLAGMAEWLNQTTGLQVHIASYGTTPLPGHVYLAPDDFHMGIGAGGAIILTRESPENHLRPAVSFLFRTLAEVYGPNALGVLLTGMGRDGAEELKAMKDKGAVTIAQDQESSVVHGMPGVAIALGGATQVLAADKIADALVALVKQRNAIARS